MANPSISTDHHDDKTHITVEIPPAKTTKESNKTQWQKILHRVPAKLHENRKDIYDPVVLSLGPYHHNLRPEQFLQVEEFKDDILNDTLEPSAKSLFCSQILIRVDEIRTFYGGLSNDDDGYTDEALVEVMLRDACFLWYYMKLVIGEEEKADYLVGRLGLFVSAFLARDFFMLENQIPFWVIRSLINLKFHNMDKEEELLCKFLRYMCFGDFQKLTRLPWKGDDHQEPLHLLEALRQTHILDTDHDIEHRGILEMDTGHDIEHRGILEMDTGHDIEHRGKMFRLIKWRPKGKIFRLIKWRPKGKIFRLIKWRPKGSTFSTQQSTIFEMVNSIFRSVTDLKAKGIHFGPSSCCLKDIKFNSYAFYGKLSLPIWFVSNNTGVFFSNMIAFEMSQKTNTNGDILAYVNFMKSLLETSKDVKELREKRILFSCLRNDEEVLEVFKEINTYGVNNEGIYLNVKLEINKHCDSKAKTWMAELIHTYFHSPCTAIALFAATFLLCLTFLQTYYTMNPEKSN